MFRPQALDFRKNSVNLIHASGEAKIVEKTLRKELLIALESARTRFAIAAASEKKYTLPVRWQYYLDTADQMCRSIRRLRRAEDQAPPPGEWASALEKLRMMPSHPQAHQLCRILREVVAELG
jgi:hypothetical protein